MLFNKRNGALKVEKIGICLILKLKDLEFGFHQVPAFAGMTVPAFAGMTVPYGEE